MMPSMPDCSVKQQRSILPLHSSLLHHQQNNFPLCIRVFFVLGASSSPKTVPLLSGKDSSLSNNKDLISSSAKAVDELITGLSKDGSLTQALQLPCLQSVLAARDELRSALRCLHSWNQQAGENSGSAVSDKSTDDEILTTESTTTHRAVRNRVKTKIVYSIPPGLSSNGNAHWV